MITHLAKAIPMKSDSHIPHDNVTLALGVNHNAQIHLNDGYASSVMSANEIYQCIEIRGVREVGVGDDAECTEDAENPDFFSCYARTMAGPALCIGDFGYLNWAKNYATDIALQNGGLKIVCLVGDLIE